MEGHWGRCPKYWCKIINPALDLYEPLTSEEISIRYMILDEFKSKLNKEGKKKVSQIFKDLETDFILLEDFKKEILKIKDFDYVEFEEALYNHFGYWLQSINVFYKKIPLAQGESTQEIEDWLKEK